MLARARALQTRETETMREDARRFPHAASTSALGVCAFHPTAAEDGSGPAAPLRDKAMRARRIRIRVRSPRESVTLYLGLIDKANRWRRLANSSELERTSETARRRIG